jgi:hypothetical protein
MAIELSSMGLLGVTLFTFTISETLNQKTPSTSEGGGGERSRRQEGTYRCHEWLRETLITSPIYNGFFFWYYFCMHSKNP